MRMKKGSPRRRCQGPQEEDDRIARKRSIDEVYKAKPRKAKFIRTIVLSSNTKTDNEDEQNRGGKRLSQGESSVAMPQMDLSKLAENAALALKNDQLNGSMEAIMNYLFKTSQIDSQLRQPIFGTTNAINEPGNVTGPFAFNLEYGKILGPIQFNGPNGGGAHVSIPLLGIQLGWNVPNIPASLTNPSGLTLEPWMDAEFAPTKEMMLNQPQVTVAGYVFARCKSTGSERREVLAKCKCFFGYRTSFLTLMPKGRIDSDVLNLVASMLTRRERELREAKRSTWFLPCIIAQYGLGWKEHPGEIREFYRLEYMGVVDHVKKIFIPMNEDNNHWMFLIIDLENSHLILLDSLRDQEKKQKRHRAARTLALFVEEMLQSKVFYSRPNTEAVSFENYTLIEPRGLNQQLHASNDCGVWVAEWMQRCRIGNSFNISVNDRTRMQLALDLILDPYNDVKDEILKSAFLHKELMKQKWERLVTKRNRYGTFD